MFRIVNITLIAGFFVVGIFTALFAQDEIFFIGEELGVGARAMGMGGAYVGVADDYTAIYWNPAGLGQLRRMELNLGFSHNKFTNAAEFLGNRTKTEDTFTRLNSLGITIPVPTYQGSLVFGIGYNKVRDYDNRFKIEGYNEEWAYYYDWFEAGNPADNEFTEIVDNMYQTQTITEKGTRDHFSFAGALEVQENFFLGASLNFISGNDDYAMELVEEDINNFHNTLEQDELGNLYINDLDYWMMSQTIDSRIKAVNVNLGGLYRFGDFLRLGATVVTPTTFTITENWTESGVEYYDDVNDPYTSGYSGTTKYKVKEPYSFNFGASTKLLNFLFTAGAEFKDWSNAQFLTAPPVGNETQNQINNRIEEDFKAVTKLRFGAEMYIPIIRAKVRVGYFTDPSPYRYTDVRPDKQYASAGASLMLNKQVMVDLGYMIGQWQRETTDYLTNSPALEDISFQKVVGTLSIRF
ncbi:outer membrane protein transport protein [candidate division KSB1 bacterium]|nr:outer membrane protein transport protein [candidate division KSB1 bacterium]